MNQIHGQKTRGREEEFAHNASILSVGRSNGVCPPAVRSLPTDSRMPPRSFARHFLPLTLITTLGLLATGCTLVDEFFDESVSLAEFAPVGAQVSVELAAISRSQIALQAKAGACPTMAADVAATVDAKAMDVFIKGGKQPSGSSWICGNPTYRRTVSDTDLGAVSTKFVVDDDSATVTVVATDLLVARTLVPTVPNGSMTSGVEGSFAWSVATDVLDAKSIKADFLYDDPMLSLTAEVSVRVEGSTLFIRLPTDAPKGTGKLMLDVTAGVPVETCEGVPSCTASVHTLSELALEVVLPGP